MKNVVDLSTTLALGAALLSVELKISTVLLQLQPYAW